METTADTKRLFGVRYIFLPAQARSIFSLFVWKHRQKKKERHKLPL